MELMKKDLVMTSREVAEITGKEHKNVMRDIREEIESIEKEGLRAESIFVQSHYKDSTGRKLPQYIIFKKGLKLLASRYRNLKNANFQEWLVENNIIVDFIHTNTRFEVSFINLLEESLSELNIVGIKQFNVNGYRIDFYIPSFKLAVEYDEIQHMYATNKDSERQRTIEKELGCEFVRCDYKDSDIKNVMKVLKKIKFGSR